MDITDLVNQDLRRKTCIGIKDEYSTNLAFLNLLQIKESIPVLNYHLHK